MPLNIDQLAPAARERYLVIGKRFGSRDTLAQAHATIKAYTTHGELVAIYGYTSPDHAELIDARDFLITAGVARENEKVGRKTTHEALLHAERAAKDARRRARAVLSSCTRVLLNGGDETSVRAVETALANTSRSGADAERLAQQLDMLREMLATPTVAAAAAERGGPATLAELELAAQTVRAASAAITRSGGTPEETERLDIVDGIIVTLCRQARAAARAASKAQGQSAIAGAFELGQLYQSDKRRAPAQPPPT